MSLDRFKEHVRSVEELVAIIGTPGRSRSKRSCRLSTSTCGGSSRIRRL